MAEVKIDSSNFEEEILNYKGTVLADFWAEWCGPCRMLSPVISEVAEERADIKVAKINVDENQELAIKYGVMSIPTVIVFKDGNPVKQNIGFVPKETILSLLD